MLGAASPRPKADLTPEPDRADARAMEPLGADPAIVGAQCGSRAMRLRSSVSCRRRFHSCERCAARAAAHRRVHHVRPRSCESAERRRELFGALRARPGVAGGSGVRRGRRRPDDRRTRLQRPRLEALSRRPQSRRRRQSTARALRLGAAGTLLALMLMVNLASVLLARAAEREHESRCRARSAPAISPSCARRCSRWPARLIAARRARWLPSGRRARSSRCAAGPPAPRSIAVAGELARDDRARHAARLLAATVPACGRHAQRCHRCSRAAPCEEAAATVACGAHDRRTGGALARAPRQRRLGCAASSTPPGGSGFNPEGLHVPRPEPPEFFPKPPDLVGFRSRRRALVAIPGVTA